jgi:hypothetical protein
MVLAYAAPLAFRYVPYVNFCVCMLTQNGVNPLVTKHEANTKHVTVHAPERLTPSGVRTIHDIGFK